MDTKKTTKLTKKQSRQLERLTAYILQNPTIERLDHVIECLETGKPLSVEQKESVK